MGSVWPVRVRERRQSLRERSHSASAETLSASFTAPARRADRRWSLWSSALVFSGLLPPAACACWAERDATLCGSIDPLCLVSFHLLPGPWGDRIHRFSVARSFRLAAVGRSLQMSLSVPLRARLFSSTVAGLYAEVAGMSYLPSSVLLCRCARRAGREGSVTALGLRSLFAQGHLLSRVVWNAPRTKPSSPDADRALSLAGVGACSAVAPWLHSVPLDGFRYRIAEARTQFGMGHVCPAGMRGRTLSGVLDGWPSGKSQSGGG